MKRAVVLLSGGLDSVVALYHTATHADIACAISFDYASKHNHREIRHARLHAKKLNIQHRVVDLSSISEHLSSSLLKEGAPIPHADYDEESMRSTVVPFRNGIMLAVAAGIAESEHAHSLVIGAHGGDHALYPDCRPEFMEAMHRAVTLGTYDNIRVDAPFLHKSKADIVRLGASLNVDFSKTWSCYEGLKLHCGTCGTCRERRIAFKEANVLDPTKYSRKFALPGAKD